MKGILVVTLAKAGVHVEMDSRFRGIDMTFEWHDFRRSPPCFWAGQASLQFAQNASEWAQHDSL